MKKLLLGDEAIAHGAIDSGLGGAFSYPGTPATEIFEYLERYPDRTFCAKWSGNEKISLEEALGMSFTGQRAIVSMKSVGINVAADPFICSAITGINGGLVVVVADDPGMHSSQNEQDARYYADFARVPCYEPADQQECYDMAREAFALSEEYKIPVLMRLGTRLAHSRSAVEVLDTAPKSGGMRLEQDTKHWVILPAHARVMYKELLAKREKLAALSDNCKWNSIHKAKNPDKRKAVIACGAGATYLREALQILGADVDYLKIGFAPLPVGLLKAIAKDRDEILVLEDGYPFVEEKLLGVLGEGPKIRGRLDCAIPTTGELNPDKAVEAVAKVFGLKIPQFKPYEPQIPARPPMLCQGCPHGDTFKAIKEALSSRKPNAVFSDIGCYTLGYFKPYECVNACVEMGASVGMAKGAAQGGLKYAVAAVGDSTFEHSALATTLAAANENTPMTIVILDNGITAMTGMQESLANGEKLARVIKGLGVDEKHIRVITPLAKNHDENTKIIGEELDYNGLSVIISQRECIQILGKRKV